MSGNQEPSGAITQSEARNQRLSHLLEAEGGEGLEAAVLKTIFGFPPHAHDLIVHVHLQSGAISAQLGVRRRNQGSQSGFAISHNRSQSVAIGVRNQSLSRQQSPSVAISRNQPQSVAYRHLGGYEELIAELAHIRDACRNQGGAAEIESSGGSEGEGGVGDVDAREASKQRT